ncbi:MAG TPA: WD40 repeat domain-containing protein [Candidatus Acidoferrales bacterium]|nr:WD40 repeat domain-containing protein [Candidatus Acidoferrales bacterium]
METREQSEAKQIIPAPSQALAVRSAAIVARGLRDLARDSNWLVKKVFTERSRHLAISPAGQLCATSPVVRHGTERVALYDIELSLPVLALSVAGEPEACAPDLPAAFAWSPTARYLIAGWGGWQRELQVFDLHGKVSLGAFGRFLNFPQCLAWSDTGRYFAAATPGGTEAELRLWEAAPESSGKMPFSGAPLSALGGPRTVDEWLGAQAGDAEGGDEGSFSGFGCTAFAPDEGTLASLVEIEGEWADDSIVLLDVPTLRRQRTFQAQGHVTDLAWTFDSRQLVYCAAGQAYRIAEESVEAESLPFGAELCACHPHLPLCLCFSSWLRNSAKGRLFLVDMKSLAVFDEYAAEGVVDLRWSLDGSKAYAVTADGLAYIYEPPLL